MKPLSLLQSLQKESAVVKTIAAAAKSYQVYILESIDGKKSIGVPVEQVEAFDAFLAASPEKVANITEHLEQFESVILE